MDHKHSGNNVTFEGFCRYMHESREEHKRIFRLIDKRGKGTISVTDLRDGLSHLYLNSTDVDVDELFHKIHHEKNGEITFEEFEEVFGMLKNDIYS